MKQYSINFVAARLNGARGREVEATGWPGMRIAHGAGLRVRLLFSANGEVEV